MTPVTFKPRGPGQPVTVIVERIVSWQELPYGGYGGTEITLDTGKKIAVGEWAQDVERAVLNAIKKGSGE